MGTGHGTLSNEMLFKDVLYLCPCFRSFGTGKLPDPFDDPGADPDLKSAALLSGELRAVFPDTLGYCHGVRASSLVYRLLKRNAYRRANASDRIFWVV